MRVCTTRFGEVEVDESLVFSFVSPIIGFEDAQKFILIESENNNIFKWLQSTEYPDLAFPVSKPSNFKIEYNFEINDENVDMLGLNTVDDVLAINIVNIPEGKPQNATINLLAPVIINKRRKVAAQIILENTDYLVKQPLFSKKL